MTKIDIIDEIVQFHPNYGTDIGWSWYHGGMEDTGDWYYKKMLDVPKKELMNFLHFLLFQIGMPPTQYTPEELADMKVIRVYRNGMWMNEYTSKQIYSFMKEMENRMWYQDEAK